MKAQLESSQPAPLQDFQFLSVTGRTPTTESCRIVRSHAIRDANRRKKEDKPLPKKSREALKPLPQRTFTTRFRVDREGAKEDGDRDGKRVNNDAIEGMDGGRRGKQKKKEQADQDVGMRLAALAKEVQELNRKNRSLTASAVSGGKFDPFDTLPVKIGEKHGALIQYQTTALKQNAFAFYSKDALFSHAAMDPAWFNATLSLISLHYDLKLGHGLSRECLFHRGEALRIVNERLRTSPRDVSDYTLGAIATLANFDTTNGLFTSATMHVQALVSVISNRRGPKGGLLVLDTNLILQKLVAWSDLAYSTTWDLAPRFPLLRSVDCNANLPEYIEVLRPFFSAHVPLHSRHDLFGEMTEIFQTLRLLSRIMEQPSISPYVQSMFSRGLYICEYKLLVVLDQTDPRDDDISLDRNSQMYGSTRLAAYLYLYLALRELPRTARICGTLGTRLKRVLEGDGRSDPLAVWSEDRHLLNWIASMGVMAVEGTNEGEYFVGILRRLKVSLELETFSEYFEALREVLWLNEDSWQQVCLNIWKVIDWKDQA